MDSGLGQQQPDRDGELTKALPNGRAFVCLSPNDVVGSVWVSTFGAHDLLSSLSVSPSKCYPLIKVFSANPR